MRVEKMLTVEELAELLHKTPAAVHQMRYMRTAPKAVRAGKRLLFPESEVARWLDEHAEPAGGGDADA